MKHQEDGYILASTIGVLLAISIVAAALVSSSVESLSRVARSEKTAHHDLALRSALSIVLSQISIDPRRRQLEISNDTSIPLTDQNVAVRLRWETNKLDINRASIEAIEARLEEVELDPALALRVITAIKEGRDGKINFRLVDDMNLVEDDRVCIAPLLTVFGGRETYEAAAEAGESAIGQPAAGSRLSIDLATEGGNGLSVVVLMTSDPLATYKVLDWRETNGNAGDECYVKQEHA